MYALLLQKINAGLLQENHFANEMQTQRKIQRNMTVYKIDTIDVDGKPEVQFKCLKRLVGERGFEPPTPWSRTRCSTRLSHSPTKLRMKKSPIIRDLTFR
jgi:hypothetical protein